MALVDDVSPLNCDLPLVDWNKNNDVTATAMTSHQMNTIGGLKTALTMDLSTISSAVINSNVSVNAFGVYSETSPTARQSTSSPDDTINEDFYYDDEFTVQFDANITDFIAVDQEMASPMVQSLNDVSSVPDNRRLLWMTSSRSDSCLVGRSQMANSDDEGEDMSTSERQDDMVSSSDDGDVSDVQTSADRPLFTPPPSKTSSPFNDLGTGCVDADAVGAESVTSGCSSTVLDCAVYDFAAAKKQYVLSFDVRNTSSRLSSSGGAGGGDELERRSGEPSRSTSLSKTRDQKKAVTVGCNGAGLTTWKQVRGKADPLPQQPETGFTTWQRLKAMRGRVPAHRGSTNESVGADDTPDGVTRTTRGPDETNCQTTSRDHTGHLLKLYCSTRNNLGVSEYGTPVVSATSTRYGTPVGDCFRFDPPKREGMTSFVVQAATERQVMISAQVGKPIAESDCKSLSERGKSADREMSVRDRRRTHRKSFADRSVQCLAPSVSDRSVQTSMEQPRGAGRQALLSTANKSLQTSSSHVDHMVRSAVLLSRPLPDLEFLRTGLPPVPQPATSSSPVVGPPPKEAFQTRQAVERKTESDSVVTRRCVTRSSHLGDQAARVRRHHSSDSAFSNNSSSSSGIDPGCYDSSSHADRTSTDAVPRKPPRLFRKETSFEDKSLKNDVAALLRDSMDAGKQTPLSPAKSCASHVDSRPEDVETGVALDDKMATDVQQRQASSKTETSLTNQNNREVSASPSRLSSSPRRSRRKDAAQAVAGDVTLTSVSSSQTTGTPTNSKPAKSILRRQRQKSRSARQQSSWSDNHESDQDDNSCCQSDDVIEPPCVQTVVRRSERPLSLPDAAVLFMNAARRDASEFAARLQAARQQTGDGNTTEDVIDDGGEQFRAKKSVSFSEKIFYHSMPPTVSPIESPLCPNRSSLSSSTSSIDDKSKQCAPPGDVIKTCVERIFEQQQPQVQPEADDVVSTTQRLSGEHEDIDDLPPSDFTVSPPSLSPTTMSLMTSVDAVDLSHKKDLVHEVIRAVEALTNYFRKESDSTVKARLGHTVENEEVGRLVIDQLCPALHAILLDGLRPHVRSFFGRVKNSAWKVVEDSVELGEPVELLSDLLGTVRSLKFLRTPWLLFNAFVISLLNVKALDFWLSHLYGHKLLMAQHYSSSAFLALSGSGVAAHRLFMDLITAVQPLAHLPFWIEFDFELRTLERNRYRMLCSSSVEQSDSMAAVTTARPRRPSSFALQDADVSQTLRTAFNRIGNRATQSLVLAKSALQNTSSVTANGSLRRSRPLSMPINLIDDLGVFGSGQSPAGSQDVGLESSSGDSVDSSGFFRRFAGQFWSTSSPRSAVYRKGVTDYNFRHEESPQSDTTPVREDTPDDQTPDRLQSGADQFKPIVPPPESRLAESLPQTTSTDSNSSRSSTLTRRKPTSNVHRSSVDSNSADTSRRNSGDTSRSKRWSDFGTRLVGFVDKVLLPVEPPRSPQRPRSIEGIKCSSDGRLNVCTLTAPACTVADQSRCDKLGQASSYDVRMQRNIFNSVGAHVTAVKVTSAIPVDRKPEVKFATTLCHCIASDDGQLSFRKATQLIVVRDTQDSDWLLCRHGDLEGLVHRACVKTSIGSPDVSDSSSTF